MPTFDAYTKKRQLPTSQSYLTAPSSYNYLKINIQDTHLLAIVLENTLEKWGGQKSFDPGVFLFTISYLAI